MSESVLTTSAFEPGGDLAYLGRLRRLLAMLTGAMGSGLLLTVAFPPLELDVVIWFALVPILLAPSSRRWPVRLLIACVFGFTHTVTNLFWLNTIGFGAGVLLALYCALFPAAWYICATVLTHPPRPLAPPEKAGTALAPPVEIIGGVASPLRLILLPFQLAVIWVALEWVQSWLFTGFPWNQLAVSQWRHTRLLMVSRLTGVYGLSFVIVLVNVGLARIVKDQVSRWCGNHKRGVPWSAVAVMPVLVLVMIYGWRAERIPSPDTHLKIMGIQGNIKQNRIYSPEQLEEAVEVYRNLTLAGAGTPGVNLVVWPESALPAPLLWDDSAFKMLAEVLNTLDCPLLAGTVNYETFKTTGDESDYRMYNSAILFSRENKVARIYDKIHRVPFGEYVPFGDFMPWLVNWIGMGRDLEPGSEYTLFELDNGAVAGVNICFEDAFPRISREFTRRGANMLMTITNDAWYAESAGSRQHALHAVFRAVENARPLFRSGNNSDTCLILPDGKILGTLVDPVTGHRFVRGYQTYRVPIATEAPLTFYTRYGDVFAKVCAAAAVIIVFGLFVQWFRRKKALKALVDPEP